MCWEQAQGGCACPERGGEEFKGSNEEQGRQGRGSCACDDKGSRLKGEQQL
jgi:hypothetical protein